MSSRPFFCPFGLLLRPVLIRRAGRLGVCAAIESVTKPLQETSPPLARLLGLVRSGRGLLSCLVTPGRAASLQVFLTHARPRSPTSADFVEDASHEIHNGFSSFWIDSIFRQLASNLLCDGDSKGAQRCIGTADARLRTAQARRLIRLRISTTG